MITTVENALVERLRLGLGKLCATVKSYGGEIDDESFGTMRFPLCLVCYAGSRVVRKTTNAQRYQSVDTFVIILAVKSLRSNMASRQGGVDKREIGVNQLISATRRLLDAQTLGGQVKPLNPKQVKTLFNHARFNAQSISAYALEYEVVYDNVRPLEDGRFPEETQDPTHPDYVFHLYKGQLSAPDPELEGIAGVLYDPEGKTAQTLAVETV